MGTRITPEVMDLLISLDNLRREGHPWSDNAYAVFEKDVRQWAVTRKLVEVNTIDGEAPVYRITEAGTRAIISYEVPDDAAPLRRKKLHSSMEWFLQKLADSQTVNDGWIPSHQIPIETVPYHMRKVAQERNWVEGRGNNQKREFKITAKGMSLLNVPAPAIAPLPNEVARISRLSVEEKRQLLDDAKARVRQRQAAAATNGELLHLHAATADEPHNAPNGCNSNCEHCVYHEAITILEKNVPGVRGLVDELLTIRGQK